MKTRTAKTDNKYQLSVHTIKSSTQKYLILQFPWCNSNSSQKSCLVQAYIFQMSWPLLIKQDIYLKFQG